MGIFDKQGKISADSMEQEIKILATNVEVLNQKLIQDPNAVITPGEAVIKSQTEQIIESLKKIDNTMRLGQSEVSAQVAQYLSQIKVTFDNIIKQMSTFPKEKQALTEEIEKLNKVIANLDKLDRAWLNDFMEKVEVFNKNAIQLNNNLISYHKGMIDVIDHKFNEISEATTAKLTKNLLWLIIAIIFLSVIFSLLFNYIGARLVHA